MQTHAFRPIRNDRLSDKAAQQMVQLIRTGELPIGTRLPNESDLANRLGVSRGVLREALTLLQAQGYISRAPREGTIVLRVNGLEIGTQLANQLRSAQYRELLEFREVMECRVVCNVIRLASDADLDVLQKLLDGAPDGTPPESPDYYFHYHLAELSGNSLFAIFIDMYYDLIHEMAMVSSRDKKRVAARHQEHQRILDAILKRDDRKAVAAVKSHLRHASKAIMKDGSPK